LFYLSAVTQYKRQQAFIRNSNLYFSATFLQSVVCFRNAIDNQKLEAIADTTLYHLLCAIELIMYFKA